MPIEITMPALSPTMEEGNLAKWLVKEGDQVSAGDVIAEIETDKATMEVEAVDEGTVAKILIDEGTEGVKVNAVIAVLAEDGEDVEEAAASAGSAESKPQASTQKPEAKEAEEEKPRSESKEEKPQPIASQSGSAKKASTSKSQNDGGERLFATPLARRIAEQNGVDLSTVDGSGPNGRIVKADVEGLSGGSKQNQKSLGSDTATKESAPASVATPMDDDKVLAFYTKEDYELLPHDSMRKTIAARLTESSQTIPVYFLSMDCELDALLALRKQINSAAPKDKDDKPAYRVSVNDFIIKAMALALRDVPMANASWTSSARVIHKYCDVGVAVAIPDGLITPVIRKAETKTLSAISTEMKDLAGRARDKKLKPEEYQGGSTAVSNLGMFGVSNFTSIINPPHASIISIGAGEERAVVREGAIATATIMTVTFAFDHRVIDGALGAQLAGAFKNYIENPMGMLV